MKNDDGEDILEFQYFSLMLKLTFFWKTYRLDNEPTPNNLGHFMVKRDIMRKYLFGDDTKQGALTGFDE